MPNVYALAAHPLAQQLAQEEVKTKGPRAVFGVILMFLILCGGVWMLLQSSFGPWQAYLISSVAFWGSWLVLASIWLTGVPGIGDFIPRSTPKYNGPQGNETSWVVVNPHGEDDKLKKAFDGHAGKPNAFFTIDDSLKDQTTQGDKAAAESAANERISEEYAIELGVGAGDIAVPTIAKVTETQLGKEDGKFKYARVTYGPADPNPTDNEPTKALISKIKPKTIELALHEGSLGTPTKLSLLLFGALFLLHAGLLAWYESRHVDQPQGAPERVPVAV